MAGVAEKPVSSGINWGGLTDIGNGLSMYVGTGIYVTTGTEVTIYHPFGSGAIFSAQATPLHATAAAAAANGQLTITGLSRDTTYGTLKSTTAGQLVVERAAGTDSALAFSVCIIGRKR